MRVRSKKSPNLLYNPFTCYTKYSNKNQTVFNAMPIQCLLKLYTHITQYCLHINWLLIH